MHVDRAFGKSGLLGVLPEADFVVLCLPHTPETRHIINAAAFDAMKPTACLINVSRGALIDEDILIAAMRAGRITGAGQATAITLSACTTDCSSCMNNIDD